MSKWRFSFGSLQLTPTALKFFNLLSEDTRCSFKMSPMISELSIYSTSPIFIATIAEPHVTASDPGQLFEASPPLVKNEDQNSMAGRQSTAMPRVLWEKWSWGVLFAASLCSSAGPNPNPQTPLKETQSPLANWGGDTNTKLIRNKTTRTIYPFVCSSLPEQINDTIALSLSRHWANPWQLPLLPSLPFPFSPTGLKCNCFSSPPAQYS